jgi:hypothetical protein
MNGNDSRIASATAEAFLPRSVDEVTAEWLGRVLARAGAADRDAIDSIEAHPLPDGFGAQCTYARFQMRYAPPQPEAPEWVFAKFSRDTQASRRVCIREVRFYRDIAPSITLRIPRCYFAGKDDADKHCVVILEDVSTGTAGDSLAGCSTETAEVLLREIGSFHARWWNDPRLQKWDWLLPSAGAAASALEGRIRTSWPQFRKTFADLLTPGSVAAGERALEQIPRILESFSQPPTTLVHGDFQLDNVRLDVDGAPFVLLDWQLLRRVPGATDLVGFLSRSLPIGQRRSDGEQLIEVYYRSLVDGGVDDYTMHDLLYDMKVAILFRFLTLAMASVTANFSSERGGRLLRAFVGRCVALIDDYELGEWEVFR